MPRLPRWTLTCKGVILSISLRKIILTNDKDNAGRRWYEEREYLLGFLSLSLSQLASRAMWALQCVSIHLTLSCNVPHEPKMVFIDGLEQLLLDESEEMSATAVSRFIMSINCSPLNRINMDYGFRLSMLTKDLFNPGIKNVRWIVWVSSQSSDLL